MPIARKWKIIARYRVPKRALNTDRLALIMPYQTADCERGFSCQNGIKTDKRNKLSKKHLNDLMTIKLQGAPLEDMDFHQAIVMWKNKTGNFSSIIRCVADMVCRWIPEWISRYKTDRHDILKLCCMPWLLYYLMIKKQCHSQDLLTLFIVLILLVCICWMLNFRM